jgi:hypothetical protein
VTRLFTRMAPAAALLWLAAAGSFLVLPSPAPAAGTETIPCLSGQRGPGSSKQQQCLAGHIPGFGGYTQSGCTMIVYLTDLKKESQARAILEPFSRAMLKKCGTRASLEIRQGKFTYTDLSAWSHKASRLLLFDDATKVPGVGGLPLAPFPDNRIQLSVEKDAAIARIKEVLRNHRIPVEAFVISSREAYARQLAAVSIAPEVRRSGQTEQVVVPAIRWGGKRDGELILGESTLPQVLTMLPAFPGHGPKKPTGKIGSMVAREVRQVLDRITREYNPAGTQTIVGFDRTQRLIFVHFIVEPAQAERYARELDRVAKMHDAHRSSSLVIRRGRLTPCVLVETTARVGKNQGATISGAAYFYTCDTGH